jgi:GxxExxY protein
MERDLITDGIIGSAIRVHSQLGPGLLESVYEACLAYELGKAGFTVERQKTLPVYYDHLIFEEGFKIDLLVNQAVIVELKTVEAILPVHEAQLLTYLRLSGLHIGLLLNFKVRLLKDGIKRMVL